MISNHCQPQWILLCCSNRDCRTLRGNSFFSLCFFLVSILGELFFVNTYSTVELACLFLVYYAWYCFLHLINYWLYWIDCMIECSPLNFCGIFFCNLFLSACLVMSNISPLCTCCSIMIQLWILLMVVVIPFSFWFCAVVAWLINSYGGLVFL